MAVSTVPAVLDELVRLVRLALPGVEVIDGQPVRDTENDMVMVGFTGIPYEAAVESTLTREQMSATPDREQYDVTSLASSWPGGDVDPKPARDRAYVLVDAVASELARDQTLGGRVMSARVSTQGLAQGQSDRGAAATVRFVIHVDAFAGR
jgi:hypothetical protein